jgi:hypothetical protein
MEAFQTWRLRWSVMRNVELPIIAGFSAKQDFSPAGCAP